MQNHSLGYSLAPLGKVLVTGGTGFIGSALTRKLVTSGVPVRIFDNNVRGSVGRIADLLEMPGCEYVEGDVTRYEDVAKACAGIDTIFHLAFINGTENFYRIPDVVLGVGVKGALNTLDAALACGVRNYVVTSSSEVYQEPTQIPTPETERIIVPDIKNPRFSYSGGKIITELLAVHYPPAGKLRTVICRPHNFYGPDMGMGHVIPHFAMRMKELSDSFSIKEIDFPIEGTGTETRAFCFIDDAIDGLLVCALKGVDREIYHIGTTEEVSIADLARLMAKQLGISITIQPGLAAVGGTPRRCPNIAKACALGYAPKVGLRQGLTKAVQWYLNVMNGGSVGGAKKESKGIVR